MNPIMRLLHKARHSFFFFGLASLLWFIFRTGCKPTRMCYPCQQASAACGSMWLASYVLPFVLAIRSPERAAARDKGLILAGLLLLLLFSYVFRCTRASQ